MSFLQSKQSTIRRSSLLRDLKRIKNSENRRGNKSQRNSNLCECIEPMYNTTNKNHNNVETTVRKICKYVYCKN